METWRRWDGPDTSSDYLSLLAGCASEALYTLFGRLYYSVAGQPMKEVLDFANQCYVQAKDNQAWDDILARFAASGAPGMFAMVGDAGVGKTEYLSHFAFETCALTGDSPTVALFVSFDTGGAHWTDKINRNIDQFICENYRVLSQLHADLPEQIAVFRKAFGYDTDLDPTPSGFDIVRVLRTKIMGRVVEGLRSKGRNLLLIIDNVDQSDTRQQEDLISRREELHRELPCPVVVSIRPETAARLRRDLGRLFSVLPSFRRKMPAPLAEVLERRIRYLIDYGAQDRRFSGLVIPVYHGAGRVTVDFSVVLQGLLTLMQQPFCVTPTSPAVTFLDLASRLCNETSLTAALTQIVGTLASGHLPAELMTRVMSGYRLDLVDPEALIAALVLGSDTRYTEYAEHGRAGSSVINLYDCNLRQMPRGPLYTWLRPLCLIAPHAESGPIPHAELVSSMCQAWPQRVCSEDVEATVRLLLGHRLLNEDNDGLSITHAGESYIDTLAVSRVYLDSVHRRTMRDDEPLAAHRGRSRLVRDILAFEVFLSRTLRELTETCEAERVEAWLGFLGEYTLNRITLRTQDYVQRLLARQVHTTEWVCSDCPQCVLFGKRASVPKEITARLDYPNPWLAMEASDVAVETGATWTQMRYFFDGEVLSVICSEPTACGAPCPGPVRLDLTGWIDSDTYNGESALNRQVLEEEDRPRHVTRNGGPSNGDLRVRISYAEIDSATARRVVAQLAADGVLVDQANYSASVQGSAGLVGTVLAAGDCLIVLLSPGAVESAELRPILEGVGSGELSSRDITVILAMIEDCEVPDELRDYCLLDMRTSFSEGVSTLARKLRSASRLDFSKLNDDEFQRLALNVAERLGFVEWALDGTDQPAGDAASIPADTVLAHRDMPTAVSAETWVIAARLYPQARVDLRSLRRLRENVHKHAGLKGGLLVTNTHLTSAAQHWLRETQNDPPMIQVIDGARLKTLLLQYDDLAEKYFRRSC